jgi:hypothetical protein
MEKGKCKISKKNPGKPNYNNPSSYRNIQDKMNKNLKSTNIRPIITGTVSDLTE